MLDSHHVRARFCFPSEVSPATMRTWVNNTIHCHVLVAVRCGSQSALCHGIACSTGACNAGTLSAATHLTPQKMQPPGSPAVAPREYTWLQHGQEAAPAARSEASVAPQRGSVSACAGGGSASQRRGSRAGSSADGPRTHRSRPVQPSAQGGPSRAGGTPACCHSTSPACGHPSAKNRACARVMSAMWN
jgi:hypothetical protein